jgi:hypothetical protein
MLLVGFEGLMARRNKSGQKFEYDIVVKWRKLAEFDDIEYIAKHFVNR